MKKAISNKLIILFIRFTPPLLLVLLTVLTLLHFSYDYDHQLTKSKNDYKKKLIELNKKDLQTEVLALSNQIENILESSNKNLKKDLKIHIEKAYQIMHSIYSKNKDYRTKDEIIKIMKDALRDIRFYEGRGYYFIHQMDGINVLHPILPKREGINISLKKDKNGIQRFMVLKDSVLNKDGYESFLFYYPHDKTKERRKIVYAEHFKPYDLMIGTGEYLDDFKKTAKKQFIKQFKLFKESSNNLFIISDKKHSLDKNYLSFINTKKESTFIEYQNSEGLIEIAYLKKIDSHEMIIGKKFSIFEINAQILKRNSMLEKEFDKKLKFIFYASIIVLILLLIISYFVSKFLEKKFLEYENSIILREKIMADQSKFAALGEMMDAIAHQWKQPLSVISTINSSINVNNSINPNSITQEYIENNTNAVNSQIVHLTETIDEFRQFFRSATKRTTTNLQELIESVLELNKNLLIKNNIKTIVTSESPIEYDLNPIEFKHVFINLIANSKDAFEELNIEHKYISFEIIKKKDHITIMISDNAGGIPEKIIDKIFNVNVTTKEEGKGTGIGLYMSKQIIDKMNAIISVENIELEWENKISKGTRFIVELPIE